MRIPSKLLLQLFFRTLGVGQIALSSPLECAPDEVPKNMRIGSYFNLNTEWSNMPPQSDHEFSPPDPSGPDKLERIRPTMLKNKAEITALKIEHENILPSIWNVKSKDEFLGGELESFDRQMKVLVQARLYDLYSDSSVTLRLSSLDSIEEKKSSLGSNLFSLLKCLGLDWLIDQDKHRVPEIVSREKSIDSVSHPYRVLTGSSGTIGGDTSEDMNQDESLDTIKTEIQPLELRGGPLHLIQNKLFPMGELWGRLETLMLYGIKEPSGQAPSDPLLAAWQSARKSRMHLSNMLSQEILDREFAHENKVLMKSFVEAVFCLEKYIRKHNLLPSISPSPIKIFEPHNLVSIIKFHITQSFEDKNLANILIWKPRGIIPGPEFFKTDNCFELFHKPIQEHLTYEHEKILTHHLIKSIMKEFSQKTSRNNQNVVCEEFERIQRGFCADEFLEDSNKLEKLLRWPRENVYMKIKKLRENKSACTIQEMFKCFNNPENILEGFRKEHKLLILFYMVHFMNKYHKPLIDQIIFEDPIKLNKKLKYMYYLIRHNEKLEHEFITKEIEDSRINIIKWIGTVESAFQELKFQTVTCAAELDCLENAKTV